MPRPRKGESRNSFVKRAIPQLIDEGLDRSAAVGKAEGMYTYYTGNKRKKKKKKSKW